MSWSSLRRTRKATFRAGEQSTIEVLVDEVDPVAENYAAVLASRLADAVNQRIVEGVVEAGQGLVLGEGEELAAIPAVGRGRPDRGGDDQPGTVACPA